jgi:hypothetical protein
MAMALDLSVDSSDEQRERVEQFTGWAIAEPDSSLPIGTAVTQQFLGMGETQLVDLQRELDLVPRHVLDLDAYALANFEWLLADKRMPGTAADWWRTESHVASNAVDRFPAAAAHLAEREPPRGTEPWAAVPMATLAAALELVTPKGKTTEEATRALMRAARFAPRLVLRDLVLARALLYQPNVGAAS